MNANSAYIEYNKWCQDIHNGVCYAIPEYILDTVLDGNKSAFSLLMDKLSFMNDAQKESIKTLYNHTETEALNKLKLDLINKGLLTKR